MSQPTSAQEPNEKENTPPVSEQFNTTRHTIQVDGKALNYSVTAGTMLLKDEDVDEGEKAKAAIFYVAYTLDDVADPASRPLTFSFNGGPGSSSVWMHLGLLGPKRVLMNDDGTATPPPYKLVENPYTLLTHSDLVFVDPVSTGYSRTVPKEKPAQFHNIKKDVESVGEFIRLWTTRNNRWSSSKYLIGESYGTTRASALSDYLQDRYGMYMNGIMLVSSILNFITARFNPGNDLPYILFLPTYTASAWYHKKLAADLQSDLQKTLAEVEAFALTDYSLALMKGARLQGKERQRIVRKLARYTGLSETYIEQTNLRIEINRFCKQLRRDEDITIGRLDSRYIGFDRDAVGEHPEVDPSFGVIMGPYTAAFYDYIRRDLGFELDRHYEILSDVHETWTYDTYQNQYVNTAEKLRKAMQANPAMKVLVCNGYYDLATPYLATQYTFDHIELPEKLRQNIHMTYYESGHMMYVHLPSLQKQAADLRKFIQGTQRE
jgi:carboxypeptidase C (cathepsin A)